MTLIKEPTALNPMPQPTDVLPGPAKVEVMSQRYAAGMFIWHPDDATGGTSAARMEGRAADDPLAKLPKGLVKRLGDHAHKFVDTVGPRS